MSLSKTYNITPDNLAERREVLMLDSQSIACLGALEGWATRVAPAVSHAFYDHQFACRGTRAFLEHFANSKGLSASGLRQHLESTHAQYIVGIFSEANSSDPFGTAYFDTRLRVGQVHNDINLPLKWFLGAYVMVERLIEGKLLRRFPHRPLLRLHAMRALRAVFNYDMQGISDAFVVDLLDTLGLDTQRAIADAPERDIAASLTYFKVQVPHKVAQLNSMSEQLLSGSQRLANSAGALDKSTKDQAQSLGHTKESVAAIAESAKQTCQNALDAKHITVGQESSQEQSFSSPHVSVVETMKHLSDSSSSISNISGLIEEIAFRTNLLALNAAVEAARAGTHGRGFAIVANEVGELAKRSSQAAQEIRALIEASVTNVSTGVESVGQVADAIQDIASASTAQSDAIDGICNAMTSVDQSMHATAQQADVIVELSEQLSSYSELLAEVVTVFKTSTGGAK